ncbi:MAG TPA: response regulator [Acidobacteriota bacterium]|nr:response regulator [Acidobacteriota bacterium]
MNNCAPLLLVEDNEDDVFIFQRAFRRAGLGVPLQVASDGQDAIDYLSGAGHYRDRAAHPLPAMIFLDLKLPRRSGHDVLSWIGQQTDLPALPVIILTSSAEQRDLQRARDLGALHYLVKPPSPAALAELVETHRSGFGAVAATDGARPIADKFAEREAI